MKIIIAIITVSLTIAFSISDAATSDYKAIASSGTTGSINEAEAVVFGLWQESSRMYCDQIMRLFEELGNRRDPEMFKECIKLSKDLLSKNYDVIPDGNNSIPDLWEYRRVLFLAQEQCVNRLRYYAEMSNASVTDKVEAVKLIAGFFRKVRTGIIPGYVDKPVFYNVIPGDVDLNSIADPKLRIDCINKIKQNMQNKADNEKQYLLPKFLRLYSKQYQQFCARVVAESPDVSQTMAGILKDAGF